MSTRKNRSSRTDDLRPEYELASLKGGVRGKYFRRATAGTNVVLLEPDVARAFPTDADVNKALRALLNIATRRPHPGRRSPRRRVAGI
jgi:hypothetical protein